MKSSSVKPLFITFEGGEGCGKSLQARSLYRKLCRLSINALLVHEPGSTPLSEKLSRLLKRSRVTAISPLSELLLFNASRAQLVNDVILSSLKSGKIVVCDRYTDSTLAYQGYGRGLKLKTVRAANDIATGGLAPDLTVLLDMPVDEGLARKRGSDTDRFESEELVFHERVRQGYLTMARKEPRRFFVVDGRQDKQTISQTVWKRVSDLLNIQSM
jgi:dTMP kinase